MRPIYYVLDGQEPRAVESLDGWGKYFNGANRDVAKDRVGPYLVSTVFLGLDHNWGDGPPMLFETMVFGHNDATFRELQLRYSTWDEAEVGHRIVLEKVKRWNTWYARLWRWVRGRKANERGSGSGV